MVGTCRERVTGASGVARSVWEFDGLDVFDGSLLIGCEAVILVRFYGEWSANRKVESGIVGGLLF